MAANAGQARRPWVSPALIAALAVMIIAVTATVWFIWIPNQRLEDAAFMEHASPAQIRHVAERVLRTPWGNQHDACLLLSRVGNRDSVPFLLRSLNWNEPRPDADCTPMHCLEALRKLTGHDAGTDPREWEAWWSANASKLPALPHESW
jgi:hypothetical protein